MSHASSLKGKMLAGVLVATTAMSPSLPFFANDAQAGGVGAPSATAQAKHPSEIMVQAEVYSLSGRRRVGIYINIGPDPSLTENQIGNAFVSAFGKKGIDSQYFVTHAQKGVMDV